MNECTWLSFVYEHSKGGEKEERKENKRRVNVRDVVCHRYWMKDGVVCLWDECQDCSTYIK